MLVDEQTGICYTKKKLPKALQRKALKDCRTYISGKITGIEKEAEDMFASAELELMQQGLTPANPFKFDHDHDKSWESYMKVCLIELCKCDAIYMLPNWIESPGAKIEYELAIKLGLMVICTEN